jgi:branched-chain amino acid transport system permease protein
VERFLQVVVDGIADGSIYAALALALVLIFRSTGVVNFAQGEMAMFATFVAWALADAGVPLLLAVLGALVFAFAAGMVVERLLIRPVEGSNPLSLVIVTLGLFIVVNSAAGWIWGFNIKEFPALFPRGVAEIGNVSLAGVLVAHRLFLDTNLMAGVLVYSFAGAALGGFDSPIGAVVGSWIIGVTEALAGTYIDVIGSDLKVLVPLGIIFVVLVVRPAGLFGSPEVTRA